MCTHDKLYYVDSRVYIELLQLLYRIMYFTVIIFTLLGLQLVNVQAQECENAQTQLASYSACQEAFQAVDSNTSAAESPLCTRLCRRLIKNLLYSCGTELEYVSCTIKTI